MLQAFGQLEHTTNELLMLHYLINTPKRANFANVLDENGEKVVGAGVGGGLAGVGAGAAPGSLAGVLGQGPAPILGVVSILTPSTLDEHDSEEGEDAVDEEPFTREELKQKTLRGVGGGEIPAASSPFPGLCFSWAWA
jgi:hypothetical protein